MRIGFFGKSGAGKTSLVNALFGLDFETGNYRATTLTLQRATVQLGKNGEARAAHIVDTPGLAESTATELAYRQLYANLLPDLDHVVWVVPAHPRTFRADQEALIALRASFRANTGFTVAMTRADTIGPNDWNGAMNLPSPAQERSLEQQVVNIVAKLAPYVASLDADDVVPCAAPRRYGLDRLINRLWAELPAQNRN